EEPPPETVIILTATELENLLPTIQSRAQKIRFQPVQRELIDQYLKSKYEISDKTAGYYVRISEGSPGRAIELALDEDQMPARQLSLLMFKALFQKDNSSAIAIVNEFINPRDQGEFVKILSIWQSFLSDLIIIKFGRDKNDLVNSDLSSELNKLAENLPAAENLQKMTEDIKIVVKSVHRNIHIRPAISSLVLNLRRYINQSA
ncbi:MAG: DNA polymerase III subunit delta' C-terminal domain-containing protein, partial [Candidatus Zixiibacteriota bacterium]